MEDLKIGIAEIVYSDEGKVLRAFFTPTMRIGNIADQLLSLKSGSPEFVQHNAEVVMASWFSKMNEIELADREQYTITSEILNCSYYPSGAIKRCKIEFTFKKLVHELQEGTSTES